MGSLLVDVRSLVIAGLSELPEFADVEATFGYRVGSKRRMRCWTQDATFSHEPAGMRAVKTFRNETGQFNFRLLIEGIGQSVEDTSTLAIGLGHAFEDWVAIRANWETALVGLKWLNVEGDGALVEAVNDKGSLAELTYPLKFAARLT